MLFATGSLLLLSVLLSFATVSLKLFCVLRSADLHVHVHVYLYLYPTCEYSSSQR